MKPKIFIGSSTAGIPIAEKVKSILSRTTDCLVWSEPGIWDANHSTFDNLLGSTQYYDFGIFIATADDLTQTNGKCVIEARDNVIFEMGIFLGALGRDRSFLLADKEAKLPTDFNGIFISQFNKDAEETIQTICGKLEAKIQEHCSLGYLSLCPSTALAIGYYKNFVQDVVESTRTSEKIPINGIEYTDFKLKVVIPADLKGNIREKASQFYERNGFQENALPAKFRNQNLWFQLDPDNAPVALMYDMPSILTGIDDAIELMMKKDFKGRTHKQNLIEQKELNNFRRVLQMQIDKSPFAKEKVEIIDEF